WRYCAACAERRAALPGHVAAMLAVATEAEPPPAAVADDAPRSRSALNAPAAAVAAMAILGFGVIVGSVVSPPAESAPAAVIAVQPTAPAPAPVNAPVEPPAAAPAAPAPAAPVQQTVTQTVPAPATPAPSPVPEVPTGPQLPDVKHVFLILLPP